MTVPDPAVRALGERAGLGYWLAGHPLSEPVSGLRKLFAPRRPERVGDQVHVFGEGLLLPGRTQWLPAPYAVAQFCLDTEPDVHGFFPDRTAGSDRHPVTVVIGEDDWGEGRVLPAPAARVFREAVRRAYQAQREPTLDRLRAGQTLDFEGLAVSTAGLTSYWEDESVAWSRIAGWRLQPQQGSIEVAADGKDYEFWAGVADVANLPLALEAMAVAQQIARKTDSTDPR
ncbi:hypothetical protein [Granulicoccus phenolivorans]|uniref:hypothetical protein n=1 Tax=Granulicoccus phenolivorans TaxID=266854 RepID=UPI00041B638F|nr:hypothetical protein [Granulicoccus phenolivorans]